MPLRNKILLTVMFLMLSGNITEAATIPARSGSPTDVQAAINQAAEEDTVLIPSGTFTFNSKITIQYFGQFY